MFTEKFAALCRASSVLDSGTFFKANEYITTIPMVLMLLTVAII